MTARRVAVSIPRLEVTGGREKTKEIYITGAVTQGNDWDSSLPDGSLLCRHTALRVKPSSGNGNEPESDSPAEATRGTVFCSEIFHRVRVDQPLSLSGSGILVYPPADPGHYLGLYLAVMESDEGARSAAEILKGITEKVEGDEGLKTVLGTEAVAPLGGLARVIAGVMAANKDDCLLSHYHSGFLEDDYGVPASSVEHHVYDFTAKNDRVSLTLRVRLL